MFFMTNERMKKTVFPEMWRLKYKLKISKDFKTETDGFTYHGYNILVHFV